MAGAGDVAGLRAFLRSRCGSLKVAFAELDRDDIGQLSSEDFNQGLQRLGFVSEDTSALFRSIDASGSGLISLQTFMHGVGEQTIDVDAPKKVEQVMTRSSSEGAWKSARIPFNPADSCPKLPSNSSRSSASVLGGVLKSGSALRTSSSDTAERPHQHVAGADLLYARMARVEEQVAAEQRRRCETEQRLTQHLSSLVGVSISEQLDVLRQQLIEERLQRQVDISALRASIESTKSLGLKSVHENLEECVKTEVDKTVELAREQLEKSWPVSETSPSVQLEARLDELCKSLTARLEVLETSTKDMAVEACQSPKSPGRTGLRLERQVNQVQRSMDALEERFDDLESRVKCQSTEEIFAKVDGSVCEQLDALRREAKAALDEEEIRASERSRALGRALAEEFEHSILSQAVAEARTEACSSVNKELDLRLKDLEESVVSKAVTDTRAEALSLVSAELDAHMREFERSILLHAVTESRTEARSSVNIELDARMHEITQSIVSQAVAAARTEARSSLSMELNSRMKDLLKRVESLEQASASEGCVQEQKLEQLCEAKLSSRSLEIKAQAQLLEGFQHRLRAVEDGLRTKLQAIINKLDSKCIEGLVPVLEGLGNALKPPKVGSVDKSSPKGGAGHSSTGWCSTSSNSGTSDQGTTSSSHQVSKTPLDETSKIEALLQENMRLREADLQLREANLELRERAARGPAVALDEGASHKGHGRISSPPPAPRGPQLASSGPAGAGNRPASRSSLNASASGGAPPRGPAASPLMNTRGVMTPGGPQAHHPGQDTGSVSRQHSGRIIPLQKARCVSPGINAPSPANVALRSPVAYVQR
eukprot:TRINITY_DN14293_c0_g1_i2.p1 TRINITY_DN14293_c0_g1~~TRINITY_DN14293_c0_g1_i2.p1  ORF type:complete len:829 (-),score=179.72 TRINITY_DN14293_c0_g1_i2:66-2552(-)